MWLSATNWQLEPVLESNCVAGFTCCQSSSGGLTSFQFVNARALNTAKDKQSTKASRTKPTKARPCGRGKPPESQSEFQVNSRPSEARAHAHFAQIWRWQEANRKTANNKHFFTTHLIGQSNNTYEPLSVLDLFLAPVQVFSGYRYSIMLPVWQLLLPIHLPFTFNCQIWLIPSDFHICMNAFNDRLNILFLNASDK